MVTKQEKPALNETGLVDRTERWIIFYGGWPVKRHYQALFKYHIPDEELGQIRSATHFDMALGNERFKEEIEQLTGRRMRPRRRGRKPSQMD